MAKQFLHIPLKADLTDKTWYASAWIAYLSPTQEPKMDPRDKAGLALLSRPTAIDGFEYTWGINSFLPWNDGKVMHTEMSAAKPISAPLTDVRREATQLIGKSFTEMGKDLGLPIVRLIPLVLDCMGSEMLANLERSAREMGQGTAGLCVLEVEEPGGVRNQDPFRDVLRRLAQQKLSRGASTVPGTPSEDAEDG